MNALLVVLLLAAAPEKKCLDLVPGASLGPVTLGMTRAEATRLKIGIGIQPLPPAADPLNVKGEPRALLNAAGTVEQIHHSLVDVPCVSTGKGRTLPASARPEELAMMIGSCSPTEVLEGGNVIRCGGVEIWWAGWGGKGGVELRVRDVASGVKCDGYIVPGDRTVSATAVHRAKEADKGLEIEAGKRYCLGTQVITNELKPAEVAGKLRLDSCATETGGEQVSCPHQGVRFRFGGPRAALSRVEVIELPRKPRKVEPGH